MSYLKKARGVRDLKLPPWLLIRVIISLGTSLHWVPRKSRCLLPMVPLLLFGHYGLYPIMVRGSLSHIIPPYYP
ncbi:hypothetical protein F5X96DRAFT_627959 [Biscogniauxia mediterranea]|nr:hypothetical protein F5X96DRAFT_627959 [Biscogniauxia mediterranea]